MSDLRPESPIRRPETARPRDEEVLQVDPPSTEELSAIQHHLVTLPAIEGGTISDDAGLGVTLVRGTGSGPDVTYAAMPRWEVADESRRLDALTEHMRADGMWPSMLVCEGLDRPPHLAAELEVRGWVPLATETVMWVGHASVVPHLDPLMRIEAVQPRSLETHEVLERHIFGLGVDGATARHDAMVAALESGRLRAWIIWLDQEPVAVARMTRGQGTAGLQGIGVTEARRGQGYGTLMTTIATRAGMATGNRIVWLSVRDENSAARAVYEHLGFRTAFRWTRWLVTDDPGAR